MGAFIFSGHSPSWHNERTDSKVNADKLSCTEKAAVHEVFAVHIRFFGVVFRGELVAD